MRIYSKQKRGRKLADSKAWIFIWLAYVFAVGGLGCSSESHAQSADSLPQGESADSLVVPDPVADSSVVLRGVIKQYCVDCHNQDEKAAGLSFETLNAKNPAADQKVWEKVVRKLRHRRMPPVGHPRPDASTYDVIVSALETSLDRAREANPNPGRTDTFRRLTRTEYRNAIRDLLALDVDVSSLLPKDEISHGFDNITVGGLSPTLLERFLSRRKDDQSSGRWSTSSCPRQQIVHNSARPDAGKAHRRSAVGHTRRGDRAAQFSARCGIRDPASADS